MFEEPYDTLKVFLKEYAALQEAAEKLKLLGDKSKQDYRLNKLKISVHAAFDGLYGMLAALEKTIDILEQADDSLIRGMREYA